MIVWKCQVTACNSHCGFSEGLTTYFSASKSHYTFLWHTETLKICKLSKQNSSWNHREFLTAELSKGLKEFFPW